LVPLQVAKAAKTDSMPTHEYVYQHLRGMIMVGTIAPGMALTIRGLAETFSMSPTPVREALRRLSSEGALQVLDNRRIMVPQMTPERFEEIIALRIHLESHAAARACAFLSDRQIDELVAVDADIDVAIAARGREQALLLNQQFHRMIYSANPNQIVMPMIESVWLQLGPFLGVAMDHVRELYTIDRHAEALAALRKRDEAALKQAIADDIADGIGGLDRNSVKRLFDYAKRD
jgi:DNA-binding GntR family transcriptional regulator